MTTPTMKTVCCARCGIEDNAIRAGKLVSVRYCGVGHIERDRLCQPCHAELACEPVEACSLCRDGSVDGAVCPTCNGRSGFGEYPYYQ